MIRKILLASVTAVVLGAGFVGVSGIAAPTEAQAQWRDYDRRYGYDRRYDRRRAYRQPAYRQRGPVYGQGYNNVPAGPGGLGRAGVLPGGRPYYTPPGGQLPNGQSYDTAPGRQGPGGYN